MTTDQQWLKDSLSDYPIEFIEYVKAESKATSLTFFNASVLPGLIQCENYARACLSDLIGNKETVERHVAFRMRRQWRVFEQENPPKVNIFLGEETLLRQYGDAEVSREQLIHLKQLCGLPNININVLPITYGNANLTLNGVNFIILNTNSKEKLYSEVVTQSRISDNLTEIWFYKQELEKAKEHCIEYKTYINEKK